jgi:hypothetical protein
MIGSPAYHAKNAKGNNNNNPPCQNQPSLCQANVLEIFCRTRLAGKSEAMPDIRRGQQ